MTDSLNQVGKYLKETSRKSDFAIKRTFREAPSTERIRDIFDPDYPLEAKFDIGKNITSTTIDIYFGRRLPNIGCCADCYCGATEAYTSDSLVSGSIYLSQPYVQNTTVVYLNGSRATRNTDYVESSPSSGQLSILSDFSTIVISYVYTTDNCTEETCPEDTRFCPDYEILAGLTTVFADRYDRADSVYLDTGQSEGGCGAYIADYYDSTPDEISTYAGMTSLVNQTIALGSNVGHVSGRGFEVVLVGQGRSSGTIEISPSNGYDAITFKAIFSPTDVALSIDGSWFGWDSDFSTYPRVNGGISNSTVLPNDPSRDFVIHCAQYSSTWVMSFGYQDEPWGGINLAATIGNATGIDPEIVDVEMETPTIAFLNITAANIQSLKVGAALDSGAYQTSQYNSTGYYLDFCKDESWGGYEYIVSCNNTQWNNHGYATGSVPTCHASIGFPVIIGDTPPPGWGRLYRMQQTLASVRSTPGNPSGLKIKGEIQVSYDAGGTYGIGVQFFTVPGLGPLNAGDVNGFWGVTPIDNGYYFTNANYVPFEIVVPNYLSGAFRWGVGFISPDYFATTLPFVAGPFLFPPNHGLQINLRKVRFEGLANAKCSAKEICGLCVDERCPPVQDGFVSETYSMFSSPAFKDFSRITGSGTPSHITQESQVQLDSEGGAGHITYGSAAGGADHGLHIYYPTSPFDCRVDDTSTYEARFEFMVSTLSPTEYSEIGFAGADGGPITYIYIYGGTATFNNPVGVDFTVPIVAGAWNTVVYQSHNNDIRVKVYPTGGTEPGWTTLTNATLGDHINVFHIWAMTQLDGSTNFEAWFKNISIQRVVV